MLLRIPLAEIPKAGFQGFASKAGPILVGRAGREIRAFRAECPHQKGEVRVEKGVLRCQKHSGVFDDKGIGAEGPPRGDRLPALRVQERGGQLEILGAPATSRVPCSHVILATHVHGAREIVAASPGSPRELRQRLERLDTTPIIVVRLWFEGKLELNGFETVVLPDGIIADYFFHLNALHPSYDAEGTVVEVHCCDHDGSWTKASEEEILDNVFRDLGTIDKNLTRDRLKPAPTLPMIQRHQASFTLYRPGDHRHRPGADAGIAGLHLAGDWTRAEWSVWMMERAVVSGLEAANRVLRSHGLQPVDILRGEPEAPLLQLSRWLARVTRWIAWRDFPPPPNDPE